MIPPKKIGTRSTGVVTPLGLDSLRIRVIRVLRTLDFSRCVEGCGARSPHEMQRPGQRVDRGVIRWAYSETRCGAGSNDGASCITDQHRRQPRVGCLTLQVHELCFVVGAEHDLGHALFEPVAEIIVRSDEQRRDRCMRDLCCELAAREPERFVDDNDLFHWNGFSRLEQEGELTMTPLTVSDPSHDQICVIRVPKTLDSPTRRRLRQLRRATTRSQSN